MKPPRIAIDFRWLDSLSLCNGQYRYAVNLIRGLAEERANVRFVVLGSRVHPVPELADIFDGETWEYRSVPRLTGRGSLYREQVRYQFLLRDLKVDALHALHSFIPMFPPVPVVETVYDMMQELFLEYSPITHSREYRLHRWAFRKFASRAIAISKTTALDLERLWRFPQNRIDVVYLAPDVAVSAVRESTAVPIILAPYNLEPRKNLLRLLEAAAALKRAGVSFELVLFGKAAVDDKREAEFRRRLVELELQSCTKLAGCVSDEELSALYRRAAVFVFPSLYEGFGLPVLEAMAAGTCVVAHQESAMVEVLGDAGWLVDMRCTEAIYGAIRAALDSPHMGERALKRSKRFNRKRMAQETLEAYEKVLGLSDGDIICNIK